MITRVLFVSGEFVINYFKEAFGITEIEENFVKRGLRYLELETTEKN